MFCDEPLQPIDMLQLSSFDPLLKTQSIRIRNSSYIVKFNFRQCSLLK